MENAAHPASIRLPAVLKGKGGKMADERMPTVAPSF